MQLYRVSSTFASSKQTQPRPNTRHHFNLTYLSPRCTPDTRYARFELLVNYVLGVFFVETVHITCKFITFFLIDIYNKYIFFIPEVIIKNLFWIVQFKCLLESSLFLFSFIIVDFCP